MKLNNKDQEMISLAIKLLNDNSDLYTDKGNLVACVVLAKSGKIYKGVNIKTSHSICAEQVAIGQAFACGERELDTIVAVKYNENKVPEVVSPCGLCRYIFNKFSLNLNVIVMDNDLNKIIKVKQEKLLPYPYKR